MQTLLHNTRVTFLGLGLMGASLALRLRGHCGSLGGMDISPEVVEKAARRGVVDWATTELAECLPKTDLLILAMPVRATLETLTRLQAQPNSPAVVLDLCSTKAQIVAAMQNLPPNFDPLGGHPMCGSELSGLEHAHPFMFDNAPFVLTPLPRTSSQARELALELINVINARPILLDAETHDHWTANTSHLPYLLAAALSLHLPAESAPLVGTGIGSTARLAGSSVTMMADILATNRENVLQALRGLRFQLDGLEHALREPAAEPELIALLEKARQQYQSHIIKDKPNQ